MTQTVPETSQAKVGQSLMVKVEWYTFLHVFCIYADKLWITVDKSY